MNREHFTSNWTHAPHLPRESINRFWEAEKHVIPKNSKYACSCVAQRFYMVQHRCLEHFPTFYASSHCREAWTLDYEANHEQVCGWSAHTQ